MKKIYVKPEYSLLKLRAEEKLATCDYPIAFYESSPTCLEKNYLYWDESLVELCKTLISGSSNIGS